MNLGFDDVRHAGRLARRQPLFVLGQGTRIVAAGTGAGLAASRVLTRWLESALYGVTPTDVTTYAVVVVLLAVTGLTASAVPVARVSRIDPVRVLRDE